MFRLMIIVASVALMAIGCATILLLGNRHNEDAVVAFSPPQQSPLVNHGPASSRVALVIGIDHYKNLGSDRQLERARSDAIAVAAKLKALGYDTILDTDATRAKIYADLDLAVSKIKPGGAALFYFAGHGISVRAANYLDGANYLVPSDAPSPASGSLSTFEYSSVPVISIIEQFRRSGARISVMVLDSCRDSPFQGQQELENASSSEAPSDNNQRSDFYVLYSAAQDQLALDKLPNDDEDPNSVFARIFLQNLSDNVRLQDMARSVQSSVATLSGDKQTPVAYNGTDARLTITGSVTAADRRIAVASAANAHQPVDKTAITREVQQSVDMARTAEADAREWAHSAQVARSKSEEMAAQADEAKIRAEKKLPGYGSRELADGSIYEGQLTNGDPNGVGVSINIGVSVYKGEWSVHHKSGFGVYESLKGHFIYAGEWKNDKKDGAVVLKLPNGRVFAGEFHDDKPDGFGVLTGTKTDPWLEQVGQFNDADASYSVEYDRGDIVKYGLTKHGRLQGPAAILGRDGHVIRQGNFEDDVLKNPA
jgi:uncharacterized caspase-like protein